MTPRRWRARRWSSRRSGFPLAFLLALDLGASGCKAPLAPAVEPDSAPLAESQKSDVLRAPRPNGGEHFGLYLMGKKVGYLFTDLQPVPGNPGQLRSVNRFVFKANVGTKVSERRLTDTRTYAAGPSGKLLSLWVEQRGDGGDQTLKATVKNASLEVSRTRPGHPDEVFTLEAPKEVAEDADQVRVSALRRANLEGFTTDPMDLKTYRVTATFGGTETRTLGGVKAKLTKVTLLSEKEKVPAEAFLDDHGRMVEIQFGSAMRAVAEPEEQAKRLDQVEVFGLTRVVLPKPVPKEARAVPGSWTVRLQGLPEGFTSKGSGQSVKKAASGQTELTRLAAPPTRTAPRPLKDPEGGKNLESTLLVDASDPKIRRLASELTSAESDAYGAAKKIVAWVHQNLVKDYGASADRATDVLERRRGDCTEHSLLSVALLRAAGVPAKRIDGLVYLMNEDGVPALYWHEWVGAFVGEWTELDPTFGQEVADATHLALGEEANAEITPLIGQLKVVDNSSK